LVENKVVLDLKIEAKMSADALTPLQPVMMMMMMTQLPLLQKRMAHCHIDTQMILA
jgi:hypothetical protein